MTMPLAPDNGTIAEGLDLKAETWHENFFIYFALLFCFSFTFATEIVCIYLKQMKKASIILQTILEKQRVDSAVFNICLPPPVQI